MRVSHINEYQAFLVVYDITDHGSYDALDYLIGIIYGEKLDEVKSKKDLPIIICGNKADLSDQRGVETVQGKNFAKRYGYDFFETSAKDDINVDEAFFTLSRNYFSTFNDNADTEAEKKLQQEQMHYMLKY